VSRSQRRKPQFVSRLSRVSYMNIRVNLTSRANPTAMGLRRPAESPAGRHWSPSQKANRKPAWYESLGKHSRNLNSEYGNRCPEPFWPKVGRLGVNLL
jgi:hypothetical protein